MKHEVARARIEAQFRDGVLPPEEAALLRAHLRGCEPCRAEYDRFAELEGALEGGRLVPEAQVARLLALGPPAPATAPLEEPEVPAGGGAKVVPLRRWLIAGLAAAAGLALAVLSLRPLFDGRVTPGGGEFQVRGGDSPAPGRAAWIRAFAERSGKVEPLGASLGREDGLLFAYTNLRGSPFGYLAIAGRDARGRVHWYHPGWTDASEDPSSVPIEAGVADRELGVLVRAPHAPGRLEVCAIFSTTPLRVRELDARLERREPWPADGLVDCRAVEVQP